MAVIRDAVSALREDRSVADVVNDLKDAGVPEMTARFALRGGNITLAQFARLACALGLEPMVTAGRPSLTRPQSRSTAAA